MTAALPWIKARRGKLNPAPIRSIPVLIGGTDPGKILSLVAEHANIRHGFTTGHDLPGNRGCPGRPLRRHRLESSHHRTFSAMVENINGVRCTESSSELIDSAKGLIAVGVTLRTVGSTAQITISPPPRRCATGAIAGEIESVSSAKCRIKVPTREKTVNANSRVGIAVWCLKRRR